jgi:hypothetical protein
VRVTGVPKVEGFGELLSVMELFCLGGRTVRVVKPVTQLPLGPFGPVRSVVGAPMLGGQDCAFRLCVPTVKLFLFKVAVRTVEEPITLLEPSTTSVPLMVS